MTPKPITLAPFQAEDQDEVKSLILEGMKEHWGTIDPSKNPDLADIRSTYAKDCFLVARLEERIVGCGAIVTRLGQVGEIVRMSVAQNQRRLGIGQKILQALIIQARVSGFQRIILETTSDWDDAVHFYLNNGFRITHTQDGDTYFMLEL
jgi:GNAT superfamily N-acetyltransferase